MILVNQADKSVILKQGLWRGIHFFALETLLDKLKATETAKAEAASERRGGKTGAHSSAGSARSTSNREAVGVPSAKPNAVGDGPTRPDCADVVDPSDKRVEQNAKRGAKGREKGRRPSPKPLARDLGMYITMAQAAAGAPKRRP